MSVRYVDCNCLNAVERNETNNRWKYKINEGIEIPTGSEISVANSLINLSGITGQSIEIEADYNETVLFNYYISDSTYQVPGKVIATPGIDRELYAEMDEVFNMEYQDPAKSMPFRQSTENQFKNTNEELGFSENIMPLCGIQSMINGQSGLGPNPDGNAYYLVPLCGSADIKIPKGIYSVTSLGELITDQINLVKNPDNFNEGSYEQKRRNGTNNGLVVNNTTNRFIDVNRKGFTSHYGYNVNVHKETGWVFGSTKPDIAKYGYVTTPALPTTNIGYSEEDAWIEMPGGDGVGPRALKYTDNIIVSAVAILPEHMNDVFYQAANNDYMEDPVLRPIDSVKVASCFRDPHTEPSTNIQPLYYWGKTPKYGKIFTAANGQGQSLEKYNGIRVKFTPGAPTSTVNDGPDGGPPNDYLQDFNTNNIFNAGTGVGTSQFKCSYSADSSGYSLGYLHEPRRIPTHDRRGNKLSNAAAECAYLKRVPAQNDFDRVVPVSNIIRADRWVPSINKAPSTRYAAKPRNNRVTAGNPWGYTNWEVGQADSISEDQYGKAFNTLNAYVQRYSGVLIYNWAANTARKEATRTVEENNNDIAGANVNPNQTDFWTFSQFFKTQLQATNAWKKTLWYRIGFDFDQLQNEAKYTIENQYGTDQQLIGVTTGANIDSSITSSVSTIFNSYGYTDTKGGPAVGGVQLFNLCDLSISGQRYNNNANAISEVYGGDGTLGGATDQMFWKETNDAGDNPTGIYNDQLVVNAPQYQSSFYNSAVMIPVQTTGKPIIANRLPILSKNGYMLVLSDIVNQDDYAGKQSELGILDMIPKSSLSNQDFISDRNFISHTLSNPKSINYINISIVNPDLTDVTLEPNSTILLKIVSPIQKPTVLMANADVAIATNEINQQVQLQAQQAQQEAEEPKEEENAKKSKSKSKSKSKVKK